MANLSNNRVSATLSQSDMHIILSSIKAISDKLPFLTGLTPEERQAMPKISWDNKQFVDDCMGFVKTRPEYLPSYLFQTELEKDYELFRQMTEINDHLSVLFQQMSDTQLIAGSENYSACLGYYRSVKQAATDGISGSQAIYDGLRRRFEAQGPRPNANGGTTTAPDPNVPIPKLNPPVEGE
jgi:hypothetical protein